MTDPDPLLDTYLLCMDGRWIEPSGRCMKPKAIGIPL
jgi:hypothetical protein